MKPSDSMPQQTKAPYVWAVVILVLIGAVVVLGVLWLRPQSEPLDVMAQVAKGLAPTIAAVLAYLKSQETHLAVNSRLDAFMNEHAKVARAEGVVQGAADEHGRQGGAPIRVVQVGAVPEKITSDSKTKSEVAAATAVVAEAETDVADKAVEAADLAAGQVKP